MPQCKVPPRSDLPILFHPFALYSSHIPYIPMSTQVTNSGDESSGLFSSLVSWILPTYVAVKSQIIRLVNPRAHAEESEDKSEESEESEEAEDSAGAEEEEEEEEEPEDVSRSKQCLR